MSSPSAANLQLRIRRAGLVGRVVCTFLLVVGSVLFLAWLGAVNAAPQWSLENLPKTAEQTAFHQRLVDDAGFRALVTALVTLGGVLLLGAVHSLRTVFAAAAECRLISRESSRELRKLGILLLFVAALRMVDLGLLLCSLVFLLFAWSLEEAVALKEEQDLTV